MKGQFMETIKSKKFEDQDFLFRIYNTLPHKKTIHLESSFFKELPFSLIIKTALFRDFDFEQFIQILADRIRIPSCKNNGC